MSFVDLEYRAVKPALVLAPFVESFWMLVNPTDVAVPVVLVPDGRVDVLFSFSAEVPYHVLLLGLQNRPEDQVIPPHSTMFAISYTLLAVEYL